MEKLWVWLEEKERLDRAGRWLERHGLLVAMLVSLLAHAPVLSTRLFRGSSFSPLGLPATTLFGMAEELTDAEKRARFEEFLRTRALLSRGTKALVHYDVADTEPAAHKIVREILERFAGGELSRSDLHTLQEVATQIMQNEQFKEVFIDAEGENFETEMPEDIELDGIAAAIVTKRSPHFHKWMGAFKEHLTREEAARLHWPERLVILPRIGERTAIEVILAERFEKTLFIDHRDDNGVARSWEELYPFMAHALFRGSGGEEETLAEEIAAFRFEMEINERLAKEESTKDPTSFYYAKAKARRRIEIGRFLASLDRGNDPPRFSKCYPEYPITVGTLAGCGVSYADIEGIEVPEKNRFGRQFILARRYLRMMAELHEESDVRDVLHPHWYDPDLGAFDELNLIELVRVRFGGESVPYLLPGFVPPGDRRKIIEEEKLTEEGERTYQPEIREQMAACKLPYEQIDEFHDEGEGVCPQPYSLKKVKEENWEALVAATRSALATLAEHPVIPLRSSEGKQETLTFTLREIEGMEDALNALDRLHFSDILARYEGIERRPLWSPSFPAFKKRLRSWIMEMPILLTYLEKQRILYYQDWLFFELSDFRVRRWLQWQWLLRAYERAHTREEKLYALAMMAAESWPEVLKNLASQGKRRRGEEEVRYTRNQHFLSEVHRILDEKFKARPRLRPYPESLPLETLSSYDPALARKIRRASSFLLPSQARRWISRQDAWPDDIDRVVEEFTRFLDPDDPEVVSNLYFLFFAFVVRSHHYPSGLSNVAAILNRHYDDRALQRFYARMREVLDERMPRFVESEQRWVQKALQALRGKLLFGEWRFAEALYEAGGGKGRRPHLPLLEAFRETYFSLRDLVRRSQQGKLYEMFVPAGTTPEGLVTMRPFTAVHLRYEQEYYILDAQLLELRQDLFRAWQDVHAPETKAEDLPPAEKEVKLSEAKARFERFLRESPGLF